jgi:hypothetical protein
VNDVLSDSSYDSDLAASYDDDSNLEFDLNYEIVDDNDVDNVHVFSYDQDGPMCFSMFFHKCLMHSLCSTPRYTTWTVSSSPLHASVLITGPIHHMSNILVIE